MFLLQFQECSFLKQRVQGNNSSPHLIIRYILVTTVPLDIVESPSFGTIGHRPLIILLHIALFFLCYFLPISSEEWNYRVKGHEIVTKIKFSQWPLFI